MDYDWLREQLGALHAAMHYLALDRFGYKCQVEVDNSASSFVLWLERTGASPWRSVEDELPTSYQDVSAVLVLESGARVVRQVNWLGTGDWLLRDGVTITHWQPISPLP